MNYKEGQVLLQTATSLMYESLRRASVITTCSRFDGCILRKVKCYYKVVQV